MRSTSGRSLLRPEVERIISAIQALQGVVVFVKSFPYYFFWQKMFSDDRNILENNHVLLD